MARQRERDRDRRDARGRRGPPTGRCADGRRWPEAQSRRSSSTLLSALSGRATGSAAAFAPGVAHREQLERSERDQRRHEHHRASLRASRPSCSTQPQPLCTASWTPRMRPIGVAFDVGVLVGVALGHDVRLGQRAPRRRRAWAPCAGGLVLPEVGDLRSATIRCVTSSSEPVGQNEMTWSTLRSDSSVIARSTTASPASNFGRHRARRHDEDAAAGATWNHSGTASDVAYAAPQTTTTVHRRDGRGAVARSASGRDERRRPSHARRASVDQRSVSSARSDQEVIRLRGCWRLLGVERRGRA